MKEDWTDQLRKKLEGHEVTPPEGLWEDICKELGIEPEPESKPAANKRLYWAAAAAILALVGFFAVYHHHEDDSPGNPEVKELAKVLDSKPTEDTKGSGTSVLSYRARTQKRTQKCLTPLCPETVADDPVADEPVADEPVQTPKTQNTQKTPKTQRAPEPLEPLEPRIRHKDTSSKWSVGLNASGGLLAANSVQTARFYNNYKDMHSDHIGKDNGLEYEAADNSHAYYDLADIVWKHRLPVRFGLSVQYQLNDHLALLSGINYTYLYSECSVPLYRNIDYDQKLHYLGVPLGIVWQLWSTNHFRIYLAGSTMLEKCISSEISDQTSQTVEGPKPWQWSVQAAAGAEYQFTPQFGIYLEPSLGYHFDDGTSLQHYYKEHPFAPSLEFGLRLHLGK